MEGVTSASSVPHIDVQSRDVYGLLVAILRTMGASLTISCDDRSAFAVCKREDSCRWVITAGQGLDDGQRGDEDRGELSQLTCLLIQDLYICDNWNRMLSSHSHYRKYQVHLEAISVDSSELPRGNALNRCRKSFRHSCASSKQGIVIIDEAAALLIRTCGNDNGCRACHRPWNHNAWCQIHAQTLVCMPCHVPIRIITKTGHPGDP
mmetsp:Transcript_31612/g.50853  ORF Transcript_31612/g.50853 Transcript_31612/m.50853 type:complete len:207 (+) Transcript_31612:481-1101(+)